MSNNFCILPFVHQEVHQDGEVLTCCKSQVYESLGNLKESSWQEIWNSDRQKEIRLLVKSGVWPKECASCKIDEENGLKSLREMMNEEFSHLFSRSDLMQPDGSLPATQLHYIGLRHSNLCNLKCIYCNHNYSTAWSKSQGKDTITEPFSNGNKGLIDYVLQHSENLEFLYIAGGEPLIDVRHLELLHALLDNNKTDIKLVYNTNLSSLKIKGEELIPIWKNFKSIHISASLDDFNERFEYIRHGGKWDKTLNNLTQLIKAKISFDIFITVTSLNVLFLPDFIKELNQKLDIPLYAFIFNILQAPDQFFIGKLPTGLKQKVRNKIKMFQIEMATSKRKDHGVQNLYIQFQAVLKILETSKSSLNREDFFSKILEQEPETRKKQLKEHFSELFTN